MLFLFTIFSLSLKRRPIISPKIHSTENDIDICQLCQGLMVGVSTMLDSQVSQDEIEAHLESQCQTSCTDDKRRMHCKQIATIYLPIAIYLIQTKGLDKLTICQKLGYCEVLSNTFSRSRFATRIIHKTTTDCLQCSKFISWSRAQKISTPSQLKSLVTRDCPKIAGFNSVCNRITDDNLQQVFDFIISGKDESVACELTKLC